MLRRGSCGSSYEVLRVLPTNQQSYFPSRALMIGGILAPRPNRGASRDRLTITVSV